MTTNDFEKQSLGNICTNPLGDYNGNTTYRYLDAVSFDGGSYICLKDEAKGVEPEADANSDTWFCSSISGKATPEYLAAHDEVMQAQKEVSSNKDVVAELKGTVELCEKNVSEMKEAVEADKNTVHNNMDATNGYMQTAEAAKDAAVKANGEVVQKVDGFDTHVKLKTGEAEQAIADERQKAVSVVSSQGQASTQKVIADTNSFVTQKKEEIFNDVNNSKDTVVKAVTGEGTKQVELVTDEGTTQKSAVTTEGDKQVQRVVNEGSKYQKQIEESKDDILALAIKPTVSGSSIYLDDSSSNLLQDLMIYGKSTQITTTGKNRFNKEDSPTYANQYIDKTGAVIGNTNFAVYKISLTAGQYIYTMLAKTSNPAICFYAENDTFISGVKYNMKSSAVVTAPENTAYALFSIPKSDLDIIQLEEGTIATPYEPYTGLKPSPSPEYPQEITSVENVELTVCGKNLIDFTKNITNTSYLGVNITVNKLDKTVTVNGTPTQNWYISMIGKQNGETDSVFMFKGGLSYINSSNFTIGYLDIDNTYYKAEPNEIIKFPTDKYVKWFYFTLLNDRTYTNQILTFQLEQGTVATLYEPYKGQTLTIPVTIRGIGDYKDMITEQDGQIGVLRKTLLAELDGTETGVVTTGKQIGFMKYDQLIKKNTPSSQNIGIVCNLYQSIKADYTYNGKESGISIGNGTVTAVRIYDAEHPTAEELLAFLQAHNLYAVFPLETPVFEPFSEDIQKQLKELEIYYGVTNIFNSENANMNVTYVADTKLYIDNKFTDLQNAILSNGANV